MRGATTFRSEEGAAPDRAAAPIVLPFGDRQPQVDPEAWLAPLAVVIGDVEIGRASSVWFASVVRGDIHRIRIGARTNLQDHCVVHVTRGRFPVEIGDEVTVGHRATVHGCRVRDGALIGIGAVVLDGAEVGEGALVAAGAVVTPGTSIPRRVLAAGVPARVVRPLTEAERQSQRERALHYVDDARVYALAGIGRGSPPPADPSGSQRTPGSTRA